MKSSAPHVPFDVVYEQEQGTRAAYQQTVTQLQRQGVGVPSLHPLSERREVRVLEETSVGLFGPVPLPTRETVIDLTNVVAAAGGNPVLLSYFSAIREQIQQTANQGTWLAGETTHGVVYISFVLERDGLVESTSIVSDRSSGTQRLQEIGLEIVRSSSPFPPFPPSMTDTTKTVVVPLEFLVGS